MKVVCLWSGGKDSCFACYKAISLGHEVIALFNFTRSGNGDSLSHSLPPQLILEQAEAIGMPLFQKAMPEQAYEQEFKNLITEWKKEKNIAGIVFGDIYLEEHREWIERVCKELDIEPIFPLWGTDTKQIVQDFIACGFKAAIVCAKEGILGKEWLGRVLDGQFIADLHRYNPAIDPCGEAGEFHTFVYGGPIFKKPVRFFTGKKVLKGIYWCPEIIPARKEVALK
jgi:diphthine-ammonia ligase